MNIRFNELLFFLLSLNVERIKQISVRPCYKHTDKNYDFIVLQLYREYSESRQIIVLKRYILKEKSGRKCPLTRVNTSDSGLCSILSWYSIEWATCLFSTNMDISMCHSVSFSIITINDELNCTPLEQRQQQ